MPHTPYNRELNNILSAIGNSIHSKLATPPIERV